MQVQAERRPYRFSDLIEEAGIGTLIWSQSSYFAATYYHHIVAAFTAGILFFGLVQVSAPIWFAFLVTAIYGAYFVARKQLKPSQEKVFYRASNQLLRAQASFATLTLIIGLVPGAERTSLWLLYLPIILLISKHCSTKAVFAMAAQSWLTISLLQIWKAPESFAPTELGATISTLLVKGFVLGLLAFIMHYLVRNIDARNETIAGYTAVSTLTGDVDMTDPKSAKQWQPLLTTLLRYLGGECASSWLCDPKTRRLRLQAIVGRGGPNSNEIIFRDGGDNSTLSMDDPTLIAQVARDGVLNHIIAPRGMDNPQSFCPGGCQPCAKIAAQMVVPINIGNDQQRSTIGVISVGIGTARFKEHRLPQYSNFMKSLANQAKPILVYAQRMEDLISLQNVTHQVSHSLDLNQVLDSILKAIVDVLGYEFATISLVDEDRRVIKTERGINVPAKWLEMSVHSLDSRDIQADVVRTGKIEIVSGWDPRFDRQIWNEFGHKEMVRIFMPIRVTDEETQQQHIIGTIEAGYLRTTRSEISEDQRKMLEAFENHAALAIEHAKLLRRVKKKAEILTSLYHVGSVIASARHPIRVLDEIAHSAAGLLGADIVMLYRYHRERHIVDQPVIHGDVGKFRPNLDLRQQNILTRLLNEIKPYYSSDARTDPQLLPPSAEEDRSTPRLTFIHRRNIKSFAGIPLVAHGETVGVMFVNYRTRHQFDDDEKQVHELFAQQAAVAIKNAEINELEREVIVREERNHLSRELHHSVSQALFGVKLQAQNALNAMPSGDGQLRADLCNILDITQFASNETGFIIDELRAPIEESRYLARGLEEYTRRIKQWYGLDVVLECDIDQPLPASTEQILLRFAREALNNAVRHARCNSIRVCCRQDSGKFALSVLDDGVGFDPSSVPPHKLGLTSLSEWASQVEGIFRLDTAPGNGTEVSVRILSEESKDDD